jgi:hypothetical protein
LVHQYSLQPVVYPSLLCAMKSDGLPTPDISINSPEEDSLVKTLLSAFPEAVAENERMVRFMAQCCLRNRSYDILSAQKRLEKYLGWRKEIFGNWADQTASGNEQLCTQILTGMVSVCPAKTPSGAGILFVRMRLHDPVTFDAHATVRCWHYIVMSAITQDPTLARTGFVVINNFEGATLSNLDISVPRAISSALSKCLPVRIESLSAVNPPWVLRMVIPIVKSVLSAKLGERLQVVFEHAELPELLSIPKEILPVELDGEVDVDAPDGYLHKLIEQDLAV